MQLKKYQACGMSNLILQMIRRKVKEGKNLMGFGAFKNIDDAPLWLQYNVMTVRLGAAVSLLCWSLRWRKSSQWVLRFLTMLMMPSYHPMFDTLYHECEVRKFCSLVWL